MASSDELERQFVEAESAEFRRRIEAVQERAGGLMEQVASADEEGRAVSRADIEALAQRIRITCALLLERIADLESTAPGPTRTSFAFSMQAALSTLLSEIEALESQLHELEAEIRAGDPSPAAVAPQASRIQRALSWIGTYLKSVLKGALRNLWSLIAHLLTPKEWTIEGKVGAGVAPFGLAEAGASITFGG